MVKKQKFGFVHLKEVIYQKERRLTLEQLCNLLQLRKVVLRNMCIHYQKDLHKAGMRSVPNALIMVGGKYITDQKERKKSTLLFDKWSYLALLRLLVDTTNRGKIQEYLNSIEHKSVEHVYFVDAKTTLAQTKGLLDYIRITNNCSETKIRKILKESLNIDLSREEFSSIIVNLKLNLVGEHYIITSMYSQKDRKRIHFRAYTPKAVKRILLHVVKTHNLPLKSTIQRIRI